jgi:hypothetical protein
MFMGLYPRNATKFQTILTRPQDAHHSAFFSCVPLVTESKTFPANQQSGTPAALQSPHSAKGLQGPPYPASPPGRDGQFRIEPTNKAFYCQKFY